MDSATRIGQAGLQGWREKVADVVSPRVADRAGFDEDQIRAAIGAAFFVLSVVYIIQAISEFLRQARES